MVTPRYVRARGFGQQFGADHPRPSESHALGAGSGNAVAALLVHDVALELGDRKSANFPSVLSSGWSRNWMATPFFSSWTVVRRWAADRAMRSARVITNMSPSRR